MAFNPSDVERLLVKTGRRCCLCGALHVVQVHHIRAKHDGGSDDIDNAIPLCPNCHDQVHAGDAVGRVSRKYSESELRLHRDRAIEAASVGRGNAEPSPSTAQLLQEVADVSNSLSKSLARGLQLGRLEANAALVEFCYDELTGYKRFGGKFLADPVSPDGAYSHRLVDCYLSLFGEINSLSLLHGGQAILAQMGNDQDRFRRLSVIYPEPIAEIEEGARISNADGLMVLTLPARLVSEGLASVESLVYMYLAGDTQKQLLKKIRRVFAQLLLEDRP